MVAMDTCHVQLSEHEQLINQLITNSLINQDK